MKIMASEDIKCGDLSLIKELLYRTIPASDPTASVPCQFKIRHRLGTTCRKQRNAVSMDPTNHRDVFHPYLD